MKFSEAPSRGRKSRELERMAGLDDLRAFRGVQEAPWWQIARATRDFVALHRASALAPRKAVLLEAAGQASGYAANTLSRYIATLEFLEAVAAHRHH